MPLIYDIVVPTVLQESTIDSYPFYSHNNLVRYIILREKNKFVGYSEFYIASRYFEPGIPQAYSKILSNYYTTLASGESLLLQIKETVYSMPMQYSKMNVKCRERGKAQFI